MSGNENSFCTKIIWQALSHCYWILMALTRIYIIKCMYSINRNARNLAFNASLYINGHSIKTMRPTEELFIYKIYYSP